jgi:hypothetical protein
LCRRRLAGLTAAFAAAGAFASTLGPLAAWCGPLTGRFFTFATRGTRGTRLRALARLAALARLSRLSGLARLA